VSGVGNKWRIGLSVCLMLVLVFCMTAVACKPAPEKPTIKFILSHPMVLEHINHPTSVKFMEKLDELSEGRLQVEYHPAGELGDWVVQYEQCMKGAIPMVMTWGASEYDPRLDLTFLAYIVDNWEDGTKIFGPGGTMIPVFDEIVEDMNMKLLGTIPTDFGSIAIRKGVGKVPTKFPDDAKGIKIRVPPIPIGIKRFEAWGFSAVPIPYAELYTALQLGTVDARAFGPPVEIWEMRDVLETYILTRDYFEFAFWLVNADWWATLSAEDQALIQEAVDYALEWAWAEAPRLGLEWIQKVKDYGIKVVELTPEELAQAKRLCYENEWPWMEEQVGKALMDKVKAACGM